jgi:hypothetical protein
MIHSYYNSDPARHARQVEIAMEQLSQRTEREKRAAEYRRDRPGFRLYAAIYQTFHGIDGAPEQSLTITHEDAVELARLSDAQEGGYL